MHGTVAPKKVRTAADRTSGRTAKLVWAIENGQCILLSSPVAAARQSIPSLFGTAVYASHPNRPGCVKKLGFNVGDSYGGRVVKATLTDYVFSTLAIGLLLGLSLGGVVLLLPLSRHLFAEYHILFDLGFGRLLYGVLTAVLVRAMLRVRPIAPGAYGEQSPVFTYWKLITVVYRLGQGALRPFVPVFLQPLVEKLYGARMGGDVALGGVIDDPYMVSVGDGTALGTASMVCGSYVGDRKLNCGYIKIGRNVTVGPNSVIFPGTEIGDDAILMVGSYVMPGTRVPAGETWRGNPARKWLQPTGARAVQVE